MIVCGSICAWERQSVSGSPSTAWVATSSAWWLDAVAFIRAGGTHCCAGSETTATGVEACSVAPSR